MRKNKRWVGVVALSVITVAALIASIAIKTKQKQGPANAITIEQAGTDMGISQIEALKGSDGNISGYKVNISATGFNQEVPMELAITYSAEANTLMSLEVISEEETDGIGSNVTNADFLSQFEGVTLPVYIPGAASNGSESPAVMEGTLKDGTYHVVADAPQDGYTSEVTMTVKDGKITEVIWNCVNADGKTKAELSENGGYTMTPDGPTWADQAKALAQYVIDQQGINGLTLNDNGKTDAVASVSIAINEFVAQMQDVLEQAGQTNTTENVTEEKNEAAPEGTSVDAVSGATVSSKAVIKAINSAYEYLIANVVNQ